MLTLEGAQAGLSWETILRKREGYRRAFCHFDPHRVAAFGPADVERLMADSSIVRNRAKILSTLQNASSVIAIQGEFGSFSRWLWQFVDNEPVVSRRQTLAELPPSTLLSALVSRELKKRGFRFVGPTTVYSFLQAVGLVNDHLLGCFLHPDREG